MSVLGVLPDMAEMKPLQSWKSSNHFDSYGYVLIHVGPEHPRTTYKSRCIREHVLVMERHLGRFLVHGELVHHINGDPKDNRIDNLRLTTFKDHRRFHRVDKSGYRCVDCGSDQTYYYSKRQGPIWSGDGHGNRLCNRCYMKRWHLRQSKNYESSKE